ncbi:hypothetical protein X975_04560, partial [Stegodyphus mimosarum]
MDELKNLVGQESCALLFRGRIDQLQIKLNLLRHLWVQSGTSPNVIYFVVKIIIFFPYLQS